MDVFLREYIGQASAALTQGQLFLATIAWILAVLAALHNNLLRRGVEQELLQWQ